MLDVNQQQVIKRENDFFQTPQEVVDVALGQLAAYTPLRILDVGCGTGVWGKGASERFPPARITGIDIDPELPVSPVYDYHHIINIHNLNRQSLAEAGNPHITFDLVIGNPPYGKTNGKIDRKLAEVAIRASWDLLEDGGFMVFLLRTAFLEGRGRMSGLFKQISPYQVLVSAARIPFHKQLHGNRTNTVSYSLFYWQKSPPSRRLCTVGLFDWKTGEVIHLGG